MNVVELVQGPRDHAVFHPLNAAPPLHPATLQRRGEGKKLAPQGDSPLTYHHCCASVRPVSDTQSRVTPRARSGSGGSLAGRYGSDNLRLDGSFRRSAVNGWSPWTALTCELIACRPRDNTFILMHSRMQ